MALFSELIHGQLYGQYISWKQCVWIFWLSCALGIFFGSPNALTDVERPLLAWCAPRVLIGMLTANMLQFCVWYGVMARAALTAGGLSGYICWQFIQCMIYGIFHWKPLEDIEKSQEFAAQLCGTGDGSFASLRSCNDELKGQDTSYCIVIGGRLGATGRPCQTARRTAWAVKSYNINLEVWQ